MAQAVQPSTAASRVPILEIRDLHVHYETEKGAVKAVSGVNLTLYKGERLALVGESGCGKTTLALSIMRLIKPPAHVVQGEILLNGRDLLKLNDEEMRLARLADVALVTQAAMNALNPVMRIEDQLLDGLEDHGVQLTKAEARERVRSLLEHVGLKASVAHMFPHELSGGMKQRVAMATATVLKPKLIIADEPTSALDVVVQRQVMTTLGRLQRETGASVILVGHDMGLIAQFADRVGVMYAGKLVDLAPVDQMVQEPLHPYSKLLLESVPGLDEKQERLVGIPGMPPRLIDLPPGCLFQPRCPSALPVCKTVTPRLLPPAHASATASQPTTRNQLVSEPRTVACHLYTDTN